MRGRLRFRDFALWATIFLLTAGGWARVGSAGEVLTGPTGGAGPGINEGIPAYRICFPREEAEKLLKLGEERAFFEQEVLAAREMQAEADRMMEECARGRLALEARIEEVVLDRDRAVERAEELAKAGREGIKAARVPWYRQILSVGKWIIAAGLVGYVAGSATK